MAEQRLTGLPGAPGMAAGRARVLYAVHAESGMVPESGRAAELERARRALAAAGAELEALAARLRAQERPDEADVVATGAMMAADPALDAGVERRTAAGRPAVAAILEACDEHADAIAALGDERLAARAEDVRSLGRRAARLVGDDPARAAGDDPARAAGDDPARAAGDDRGAAGGGEAVVLVADDLGPADVAELNASVVAVALAAGAPTGHAAVVARGLGIPLAVRLGPALMDVRPGAPIAVDGDAGTAALEPSDTTLAAASAGTRRRLGDRARAAAERSLPALTRDGRRVRVLVNAATVAEIDAGLDAGAEGVGLLRTELGFLDAPDWPGEADHRAMLAPLLSRLRGRTATVRVLDFGGDKVPPFLRGTSARGVALLLTAPDALAAQLRAIAAEGGATDVRAIAAEGDATDVRAIAAEGGATDVRAIAAEGDAIDLRVLLPIAERAADVEAVRTLLPPGVAVGAMVESVAAVEAAAELAAAADFLSIGTNDLAHAALRTDRFAAGTAAPVHDPRVLQLVARTAEAARAAGVTLEVCGESASDPVAVPLLVGLGVDELSVGAARVGTVRAWVRELDHAAAARTAREALALDSAGDVEALVAQAGDAAREGSDGRGSVVAVGPQA